MSQPYNAAEEYLIKEFAQATVVGYTLLALTVMLPVYEFVITFDQEVAAVWTRGKRFSFGSFLLVSTRWCLVLAAVIACLPPKITGCKPIILAVLGLELVGSIQVAVFSALRVSAIWGRNWSLFSVVLVLGLVPVVTNSFDAARYIYALVEGSCVLGSSLSVTTVNLISLSSRIPVIIADTVVLVLTWVKTYKQVMTAKKAGQTMFVSHCLFRDGTIYFVVLFTLNLLDIVLRRAFDNAITNVFIISIPPILVSRFMLNLRHIDNENTQTISKVSSPRFRDSIFGDFGESLDHGAFLLDEGVQGQHAVEERLSTDDEISFEDSDSAPRASEASKSSIEVVARVRETGGCIV